MMMSMLQNSFANPSSSRIQSRITGNLVFILLPPISHVEIFGAYILASIARGLCEGGCVWVVALFFIPLPPSNLLSVLAFALLRSEEHTSELPSLMRLSNAVFVLTKKLKSKLIDSCDG